MDNPRTKLAKEFVGTGAFKWDQTNPFKLSSGVTSPFYVDCKQLMAVPSTRNLVARLAFEQIKNLKLNCLGGLEIGAIAIATCVSDYAYLASPKKEWRTFVVRKHVKDHGLRKTIEGAVTKGDVIVIVDDVLTSGGSILQAVDAARNFGLHVDHALVIVDREEQRGRERLQENGITLHSILTISALKKIAEVELVSS